MAYLEYLTDLTVFLNDALTVHQAKAMSTFHLMVEHLCQFFLRHSSSRIHNGEFHIVGSLLGIDIHPPTLLGKLTGIVCQRVQHEKRQHTVSLDYRIRRLHCQVNAFHLETRLTAAKDIKKRLNGEAFYMQAQFSLP